MTKTIKIILLLAAFMLAVPVTAQIRIHADYPGGNVQVEKMQNDTVWINPDLRDTEGFWFYWNFAVEKAKGKNLVFKFPRRACFTKAGVAVSTDKGATWEWQHPEAIDSKCFTYSFASNKEVRFAFAIPYTQSNWDKFTKAYRKKPGFTFSTLTTTKKGREAEMLTVRQSDKEPQVKVLFTARHHACEMTANYVMEGIIAAIAEDQWMKENVEFRFIPFVDKDGVEDGDQGKNRRPWDHNRDYTEGSIHETIVAIKETVPVWMEGKTNVVLDLHCPYSNGNQNDTIFFVGSKYKEMEAKQLRLSDHVIKNNRGELKYTPISFSYYGVKPWTTASAGTGRQSMSSWAIKLENNLICGTVEFPYGVNGSQIITAENAREFGRDLAAGLRDFLIESLP